MGKNNQLIKHQDSKCLNCEYPFSGQENFCPECGQKNKGLKLTFINFIQEVFKGFITWDSKFWNTIIPLTIKPGKVSLDYIEGKRVRYANPFRFYLTISIIFFLIIAFTNSYNKFSDFRKGKTPKGLSLNKIIEVNEDINIDSIQKDFFENIDTYKEKDSLKIAKKLDSLKNSITDSIKVKDYLNSFKTTFANDDTLFSFIKFQKKHSDLSIDDALDSLHVKKTFTNRFWYSRSGVINSFLSKKENIDSYRKQMLSYTSISLFILLPLFTLFLKLLYFRKKYTYIAHLVFVFHIQTVFFLLFSIFYIINFIKNDEAFISYFLFVFMLYLFLAMKKFYGQGFFKTLLKYILANTLFFIFALFGIIMVSSIAFALY